MSERACPHCHQDIRAEAILCRHCHRSLDRATLQIDWVRDPEQKLLGGVSGMLGRAAGISPTIVRLTFIGLALFAGGMGFWLYGLLWLCTPLAGKRSAVGLVMEKVESLLFSDREPAADGPRWVEPQEDDEQHGWPRSGPVGAGPMPPEIYRSRYDADDDEWKKRS